MRNLSILFILCTLFVSCADSTSSGYCGNNLRNGNEDCDGNDFGSVSCESLGLGGGTLYCNDDCTVNTAGCFNTTCGNGTADGPEECDEEDFSGESCQSRGYTGGTLTCTSSCTIDESSCSAYDVCGDGFIGTTEECESDTTPLSCEDLGHYSGEVECAGCTWDVSGCERCGDSTIQTAQGEECDGDMLNSETCEGLTGIEGDLVCSNQCSFSFRNCMEIHQYGSGSDDEVARVIRASDGNLILVGTTSGNMDGETNSGGTDVFVKKINPEGTPLWTVLLGGEGNDYGRGVAQDSSGNIIVTGYSSGPFNGNASAGYDDLLIASLDSTGAINWGILSGTPVGDYGEAVTVDSDGNIYVAGYTYGDLDGETNAGGIDVFMVKYSSSGVRQWTALHGTPQNDYPTSVRSDSIGNTFVSGYTFGIMGQDHFGGTDAILMKINRSGVLLWIHQFGTSSNDGANDVFIAGDGSIWTTGYTQGDLASESLGDYDAYTAKHNSLGSVITAWQFGSTGNDYGNALSGNADYIMTAAMSEGDYDYWTNAGSGDVMLHAITLSGGNVVSETRHAGCLEEDKPTSATVDTEGNLITVGNTSHSLGSTWFGGMDIFMLKTPGIF